MFDDASNVRVLVFDGVFDRHDMARFARLISSISAASVVDLPEPRMAILPEETQRTVLAKMAKALKPGGRLLFTAPRGAVTWMDSLTGLESRSLSAEEYESLLRELGFDIEPGRMDAGENYYYLARKNG